MIPRHGFTRRAGLGRLGIDFASKAAVSGNRRVASLIIPIKRELEGLSLIDFEANRLFED